MSVAEIIYQLKSEMKEEKIYPENGLGSELFLFSSTLVPVVNVDLLVINEKKQVLLSWRDDPHCGTGWHVPGGCVRLMETFAERIQRTARAELGTGVVFDEVPVYVFEIFSKQKREGIADQRERAHFITVVFACRLPEGCMLELESGMECSPGDLQWFDELPDNLLGVQECYREKWNEICDRLWRN